MEKDLDIYHKIYDKTKKEMIEKIDSFVNELPTILKEDKSFINRTVYNVNHIGILSILWNILSEMGAKRIRKSFKMKENDSNGSFECDFIYKEIKFNIYGHSSYGIYVIRFQKGEIPKEGYIWSKNY